MPDEATLTAIATLDRLKVLGVGNWMINDAGLARLAGMPRLKRLLLDCAMITDSGLATLATMPALEELEPSLARLGSPSSNFPDQARPVPAERRFSHNSRAGQVFDRS